MRTLMASPASSRSRAHLCMRAAYRHDHAIKLCTMHVCAVASCELHARAIVCPTLAYGRSEASRRVSGPVDGRASCRKASMQCPLYVTQDPSTVKKLTDFVIFTCLYFASGGCLTELHGGEQEKLHELRRGVDIWREA